MAFMDYEGGSILGVFETKEAAVDARKAYRAEQFKGTSHSRDQWDEYSVIDCPLGELLPAGGRVVDSYRATKR